MGNLISQIYKAKSINKDVLIPATDPSHSIRYITRTAENNGCELIADIREINPKIIEKGNAISIGDTTATCFYQNEDFIAGDHIVVIRADDWLNQYTALYILTFLNNEQFKYSYGRAFLKCRIEDTIIKLPVTDNNKPDWRLVENYIKSLHHKPLTTQNTPDKSLSLATDTWKSFITEHLFYKLENGKANQQLLSDGSECFYVGAKRDGNGVMLHCAKDEDLITKGNCIVFICNGQGSVGYANYMNTDFIGTTDIVAGYNDQLNQYIGIFLATIYSLERPKYSYGRKWKNHLKTTVVALPVKHNTDGSVFIDKSHKYSDEGYVPDWEFMENYIKSLPYGDRI